MDAVMGLSVRIGDESRAILKELARGLLNSLQGRVPRCSRKMVLYQFLSMNDIKALLAKAENAHPE